MFILGFSCECLLKLANALPGVERGDIQFGDTVVVSGCGPIGAVCVLLERAVCGQHVVSVRVVPLVWAACPAPACIL